MKIKQGWSYSKELTQRARQIARNYNLKERADLDLRQLRVYISSRYKRLYGTCYPDSHLIVVSEKDRESKEVGDILKHELAHFKVSGHGPKFQDFIMSLELENEEHHRGNV